MFPDVQPLAIDDNDNDDEDERRTIRPLIVYSSIKLSCSATVSGRWQTRVHCSLDQDTITCDNRLTDHSGPIYYIYSRLAVIVQRYFPSLSLISGFSNVMPSRPPSRPSKRRKIAKNTTQKKNPKPIAAMTRGGRARPGSLERLPTMPWDILFLVSNTTTVLHSSDSRSVLHPDTLSASIRRYSEPLASHEGLSQVPHVEDLGGCMEGRAYERSRAARMPR